MVTVAVGIESPCAKNTNSAPESMAWTEDPRYSFRPEGALLTTFPFLF